jgi:hypothetical protein
MTPTQKNTTIFRNIHDTDTAYHITTTKALQRIKDGASRELINKIRNRNINKSERQELKKQLPAICFSGIFTKRNDASLQEHSGFICLDFDDYEKRSDLMAQKERLSKDRYVYSVFESPSGLGLKALVRIPPVAEKHVQFFNSMQKYFASPHFDAKCKNVGRVCYESFDPTIYINEESEVWTKVEEPEYVEVVSHRDPPTIPITDENKIVDILVKWWLKKYPMVEGSRNANTYVLAMAFNDYGIAKSLSSHVLRQYSSEDFTSEEINRTIESAYSNTGNFGTKYYEDDVHINQVKSLLKSGVTKKEIRLQLKESSNLASDVIESVLTRLEEENESVSFWTKSEKGVIKIDHLEFKEFLEDNGFYKFCPEGSKNYVFVKVTNNLIDHTSEKEIKDFILNYLLSCDDRTIYNFFADSVRFFREEFLTLLSTIDIYFIADTKEVSYLYYLNCAVKIGLKEVEVMDYIDLGGYVWKEHVINRNFLRCEFNQCDFSVFIGNICSNNDERKETMETTIGYLMHGYKNLSYCPAVILNDEVISDSPEGGTGKGLVMSALAQMKKLVVIDGKAFAFERSFPYQLVSADTQILCFDDVKKNFDFERLFSVVTEGLTLEKKNKDAIKIPFDKSPKIAITTNYPIKGSGNSFERRKWELELHQHYNKDNTPVMEFGKHFFADWDDEDWCKFDNYMIDCLTQYLNKGLVKSDFINLEMKKTLRATGADFMEWCGVINSGEENNRFLVLHEKNHMNQMYVDFITEYPDYAPMGKMTVTRQQFHRWVVLYSKYKYGVEPEVGRDSVGKWVRMRLKHELEVQSSFNI